jgi:hypothetical protein
VGEGVDVTVGVGGQILSQGLVSQSRPAAANRTKASAKSIGHIVADLACSASLGLAPGGSLVPLVSCSTSHLSLLTRHAARSLDQFLQTGRPRRDGVKSQSLLYAWVQEFTKQQSPWRAVHGFQRKSSLAAVRGAQGMGTDPSNTDGRKGEG